MDPGNDRSSIKITGDEFESVPDELAAYALVIAAKRNDCPEMMPVSIFPVDSAFSSKDRICKLVYHAVRNAALTDSVRCQTVAMDGTSTFREFEDIAFGAKAVPKEWQDIKQLSSPSATFKEGCLSQKCKDGVWYKHQE